MDLSCIKAGSILKHVFVPDCWPLGTTWELI
ncbi:MAG: hypothetical protein JWN18_235 [Parcubacteria group bacterium]|nr:hypothetical protein [Parcubacteria group bacterium]